MPSTYDDGFPTDKDKVRHYIGDIGAGNSEFFLSDDEIDLEITQSSSVLEAAANAAEAIAARLSTDVDYRFGDVFRDASQAQDHFESRAERLRNRAKKEGSGVAADIGPPVWTGQHTVTDDDDDAYFEPGMHDNN